MKETPQNTITYFNIKNNLREYNKILKRWIYHAKADFYNETFDNCKYDSKKTWQKIKEVIKSESNTNLPENM